MINYDWLIATGLIAFGFLVGWIASQSSLKLFGGKK
jgi:predicted negative regulator of RcsB-dependent stress response